MSSFISKQMRVRREAKEREESMKYYAEHKSEIESRREAIAILAKLSKISYVANKLTADDVLSKVKDRSELDFYYYWCGTSLAE